MSTLDQIAETGIFSKGLDGSLQRAFVPFNEELTAELFAEDINAGQLSIEDTYKYFWSYEEDAELWGLQDLCDDDCRALLPTWRNLVSNIGSSIENDKVKEFVEVVIDSYIHTKQKFLGEEYNPFLGELLFITRIIDRNPYLIEVCDIDKIASELYILLHPKENRFYGNIELLHSRNLEIIKALSNIGRVDKFLNEISPTRDLCLMELIGETRDNAAIPIIMKQYSIDRSFKEASYYYLIDALNNIGTPEAIEAIGRIFNETGNGVYELATLSTDQSIEFLFSAAKDSDHPFQCQAIEELLHVGYQPVLPYALKRLEEEYVSPGMIKELGKFGDLRAVEPLTRLLKDKNQKFRNCVASALFDLLGKDSEDTLLTYVSEGPDPNRHYAFFALAEIEDKMSVVRELKERGNFRLDVNMSYHLTHEQIEHELNVPELMCGPIGVPYFPKCYNKDSLRFIAYSIMHPLCEFNRVENILSLTLLGDVSNFLENLINSPPWHFLTKGDTEPKPYSLTKIETIYATICIGLNKPEKRTGIVRNFQDRLEYEEGQFERELLSATVDYFLGDRLDIPEHLLAIQCDKEKLLDYLHNLNKLDRHIAARLLVLLADKQVIESLISYAFERGDSDRHFVSQELKGFGTRKSIDVLLNLALTDDVQPDDAVYALEQDGSPKAIDALIQIAESEPINWQAQEAAIISLGKFYESRCRNTLIRLARYGRTDNIRETALSNLDPKVEEEKELLKQKMEGCKKDARIAIKAFAKVGEIGLRTLSLYLSDPSYKYRSFIPHQLKVFGEEIVKEEYASQYLEVPLLSYLRDRNPLEVIDAIEVLAELCTAKSLPYLTTLLNSEDLKVRKVSIRALRRIKSEEALEVLSSYSQRLSETREREIFKETLSVIGGRRAAIISKKVGASYKEMKKVYEPLKPKSYNPEAKRLAT